MSVIVKQIRQDPRWPQAHERLRELYLERVPSGMSQADFGEVYGLGTQGMVWQYLNGYTPLNVEAAAKFAKGLRCTIEDISPEMARTIKADILSVMRRRVAKVALWVFLALPPFLATPQAEAASFRARFNISTHCRRLALWLRTIVLTRCYLPVFI